MIQPTPAILWVADATAFALLDPNDARFDDGQLVGLAAEGLVYDATGPDGGRSWQRTSPATLADLLDVDPTAPVAGQYLGHDGTSAVWTDAPGGGSGLEEIVDTTGVFTVTQGTVWGIDPFGWSYWTPDLVTPGDEARLVIEDGWVSLEPV